MRKLFSIRLLVLALGMLLLCGASSAQIAVGIAVSFAPPELPVYEQPLCPGDGYIWVPGYWAWDGDGDDYYWVPGTWVEAPEVGFLWTPGYWGWGGSAFFFHEGYWGPVVGFYGGINYGFGYFGHGYEGGRWDGGRFYYNRAVNNVNVTEIHNVYNTRVENNYRETRVSYNGGNGGINERPSAREEAASRERHIGPIAAQTRHVQEARGNQSLRASQNHGRPAIAATARPGAFNDRGVVAARSGGNYNPPPRNERNASRPPEARNGSSGSRPPEVRNENNNSRPPEARTGNNASRPPDARHASDLPPITRSSPRDSGNAAADRKYQQQQDKMYAKQQQDRAKLQQRQEQDHQRITQQNANEARKQQVEQRHQQQTQQLAQKHTQQQQRMEQHAPQPRQQNQPNPKEKH